MHSAKQVELKSLVLPFYLNNFYDLNEIASNVGLFNEFIYIREQC